MTTTDSPAFDPVRRTRDYYALVDAGDVAGVLEWFAEDAVYHRPGYQPLEGREALGAFYGGERVIESGAHHVDDIVADGRRVAVRGRFAGRLRDGSDASVGFADFIDYDADGRAAARRTFFDRPAV